MTVTLGIALVGLLAMLVGYAWLRPFRSRSTRTYRRLPVVFWPALILVIAVAVAVHSRDLQIVLGGLFWLLVIVGWAWERSV